MNLKYVNEFSVDWDKLVFYCFRHIQKILFCKTIKSMWHQFKWLIWHCKQEVKVTIEKWFFCITYTYDYKLDKDSYNFL